MTNYNKKTKSVRGQFLSPPLNFYESINRHHQTLTGQPSSLSLSLLIHNSPTSLSLHYRGWASALTRRLHIDMCDLFV